MPHTGAALPKTSIPARGLLRMARYRARWPVALAPKDLNPRQGITTLRGRPLRRPLWCRLPKTSIPARGLLPHLRGLLGVKPEPLPKTSIPARGLLHDTRIVEGRAHLASQRPQSPPGDYYMTDCLGAACCGNFALPKTSIPARGLLLYFYKIVRLKTYPPKDLNPRQGITTQYCGRCADCH